MTGVEILATQEVAISVGFDMGFALVMFFTFLILGTSLGFLISVLSEDFTILAHGVIISLILGLIFGFAVGFGQSTPEYETQYKVTISDEVSMNEFLERYEIIDQEGKIYTVREKNNGK